LSSRKFPVLLALALSIAILVSSFVPSTVATAGQWRLLSPTEYTTFPASNLRSVFMVNGGTSGKGSGNGWAVGENGLIFFWDGFSWNQATPPSACTYDSVNFGGPLNPISNGAQTSSGWTVGLCGTAATSLYWSGVGWQSYPVPALGASEARSVFLIKSASSTTDNVIAIAVGNDAGLPGGAIWTWNGVPGNGGGWVELPAAPTPNNLNSVYMTQAYLSTCVGPGVQGVAVGDSGTILTDCGTWSAAATPVAGTNLYGVAMSSSTSGWAVGDVCTIIRTTDGLTWAKYSAIPCTDPTRPLRSIVLLSSSEGWAVGDSDVNGHPTILHGTSLDSSPQWTQIPVNQVTPTGLASSVGLNSITFATSGGNLWAVGASGVAAFCQNNCSSMSGSIWSTTTSPLTGAANYQLNSVFMDGDSDGWAVGQNPSLGPYLIQWNGYSWTQAPSVLPIVTAPLYGVAMSGSSNAWAVGGTGTTPSTIYFNGNSWTGVAAPGCLCILKSVFMIGGAETWAVGTIGVIMHSTTQGGTFSSTTSPVPGKADLDTVFFADSQNGWAGGICTAITLNCLAVGDPIIIHTANDGGDNWGTVFTAGNGLPTASGLSYTITSLFFQDNTHGWATASSGFTHPTLMLFWNGVSWTNVSPITTHLNDDLFGISVEGGTPATDGWAVGQDSATSIPITIHYDGTSWTEMSLTPAIPNPAVPSPNGGLLALYLRSSTNGLAVGTGFGANTLATILHLDPPGSFQNTVVQQTTVTNIVTTSPSATTSSTSATSTSSSTSESSSSTSESTSSATTPVTTVSTTMATVTVGNTPTTTTAQATSSVSTPMALPPIPGFPLESILAGILVGIAALAILRRRRK
jgi:hypothetical protein